jgi:small basic protein (TIGR04137 family)
MTIDKTLKVARGMVRSRSVLSRAERLQRLKEVERWAEGDSPLGLPKVRVYKLTMKKKKKKKEEGEEGAEGAAGAAAPAAGGAAAKPGAAAAPAKPAAGGKPGGKK